MSEGVESGGPGRPVRSAGGFTRGGPVRQPSLRPVFWPEPL